MNLHLSLSLLSQLIKCQSSLFLLLRNITSQFGPEKKSLLAHLFFASSLDPLLSPLVPRLLPSLRDFRSQRLKGLLYPALLQGVQKKLLIVASSSTVIVHLLFGENKVSIVHIHFFSGHTVLPLDLLLTC